MQMFSLLSIAILSFSGTFLYNTMRLHLLRLLRTAKEKVYYYIFMHTTHTWFNYVLAVAGIKMCAVRNR